MDLDEPLTVEVASAPLRAKFLQADADLEILNSILERIRERGCMGCFVVGNTHEVGHKSDLTLTLPFAIST
jgi:hypothetical protein